MCLKYYVRYRTCDHHEYLGSHHCSLMPCDLDKQHFHYFYDDFPVPQPQEGLTEESVSDKITLTCKTCAMTNGIKLDPDELPVQYYPPTKNFTIEERRPTGRALPVNIIRAENKSEPESDCDCDYEYDNDYKSLSAADDQEWDETDEETDEETDHVDYARLGYEEALTQRALMQAKVVKQASNWPNHLVQQWHTLPFVPLGPAAGRYPMSNNLHYHQQMGYLAPPWMPSLTPCYGYVPAPSSVHKTAAPSGASNPCLAPMPWPTLGDTGKPTIPAVLPERPATPPPTPPLDTRPHCPRPPFIVGSLTHAWSRIEAAKHRHLRYRARRAKASRQDGLSSKRVSLGEFVVEKRNQKGRQRAVVDVAEDLEIGIWPILPFASEASDVENGGQDYT